MESLGFIEENGGNDFRNKQKFTWWRTHLLEWLFSF